MGLDIGNLIINPETKQVKIGGEIRDVLIGTINLNRLGENELNFRPPREGEDYLIAYSQGTYTNNNGKEEGYEFIQLRAESEVSGEPIIVGNYREIKSRDSTNLFLLESIEGGNEGGQNIGGKEVTTTFIVSGSDLLSSGALISGTMSLPNFMNIVSIKSSEGTLTYSMNGDILNVEVIGGDYNNGYNAKQETKTATYNQTTSSYTAAHQSVTYEAINSNPNYAATSTAATCKSWTQTTISLGYECVEPSRLNVNLAACANLSFNSTTGLFSHPYGMGCNQTYECFACWASASNTNCGSGFGCFGGQNCYERQYRGRNCNSYNACSSGTLSGGSCLTCSLGGTLSGTTCIRPATYSCPNDLGGGELSGTICTRSNAILCPSGGDFNNGQCEVTSGNYSCDTANGWSLSGTTCSREVIESYNYTYSITVIYQTTLE